MLVADDADEGVELAGDVALELSWPSPGGQLLFAAVSRWVVGGAAVPACPDDADPAAGEDADKNDPNDARSAAIVALRAPELIVVRVEDHATVLRLLARRHSQISWARNKAVCRLHALVGELVAGGIAKQLVVSRAFSLLESLEPVGAVARERHRLALDLLDDIARCDRQRKESNVRIREAVAASATTLTEIFGVGDVIAATLIGHTGDITRFATADKFAAYNGTAPVERSSGNPKRPRIDCRAVGTAP